MKNKQNHQFRFKNTFHAKAGDHIENRVFNENGEPLLTISAIALDEHLSKQHSAYSEIEWELEDSKYSFYLAKKFDSEDAIRSALFVSALMAYGRVFTQAEGRNGVKLEGTTHWLGSEQIATKRHNELMDFRHKLIAHTGESPYRMCQTSIVTSLKASEGQQIPANSLPRNISFGIAVFKMGFAGFGNEDIDDTILHIESILFKVQEKKKSLEARLTQIAIDLLLEKS